MTYKLHYIRSKLVIYKLYVILKGLFLISGSLDRKMIDLNVILFQVTYPDESNIFPLFRLSFLWITPIGVLTVIIVGAITSLITGKTNTKTLDPDLISPVVKCLLPPEAKRYAGSAIRKLRNQEVVENERRVSESQLFWFKV